jgi:CRISPR/Cas system CSM-associated protein Csm3 (group 7 of RAMP superfamily)
METKYFKCRLLTDVVLNAQTATEGSPRCLDYIPGANFLGIVASALYGKKVVDDYEVFHSGNVRFGNARIFKDGNLAYHVPASWFYPKGYSLGDKEDSENGESIENTRVHHKVTHKINKDLISNGIQLKQARKDYFLPNGELISIKLTYNQKSAHDKDKRRSKDGQMFGYQSIPQGSEFVFKIDCKTDSNNNSDTNYINKITKALCGIKHLGRSRTAQYGLVEIEEIKEIPESNIKFPESPKTNKDKEKEELVIYAESDLCFFNDFGEPTLQPNLKDFKLKAGIIQWDKSQILTRSYAPWNGKRQTREADRLVIQKGSVIVVSGAEWEKEELPSCVGEYKAEGLGNVLYNPSFLEADKEGRLTFKLHKPNYTQDRTQQITTSEKTKTTDKNSEKSNFKPLSIFDKDDSDNKIITFLSRRKTKDENKNKIQVWVEGFVEEHRAKYINNKTSSQWGGIRSRANAATSAANTITSAANTITSAANTITPTDILYDSLLKAPNGYLVHGEKQWKHHTLEPIEEIFRGKVKPQDNKNEDIKPPIPAELIPQLIEHLAARMQKECQIAKNNNNE